MILKPAPERPLMPEQEKQNIARDDWREHKRNQYQGIEKAAPDEAAPRKCKGYQDTHGQADRRRHYGDAQGKLDGGQFLGSQRKHYGADRTSNL